METSSPKGLLPEAAVRTHPKSWFVATYCIFFTCGTAVADLAHVIGWQPHSRSEYVWALLMALFFFALARHRTRTNVPA